ncbi:MAG: zinc ribbon domain-containing protein [Chloroflexi bacterium]|nr:zinc ribbon domain-containing protein [Chloroflexota bacterium]
MDPVRSGQALNCRGRTRQERPRFPAGGRDPDPPKDEAVKGCPACGHAIEAVDKFCAACGAPLARLLPERQPREIT